MTFVSPARLRFTTSVESGARPTIGVNSPHYLLSAKTSEPETGEQGTTSAQATRVESRPEVGGRPKAVSRGLQRAGGQTLLGAQPAPAGPILAPCVAP